MKKILAIIVAALIAMSFSMVAVAADEKAVEKTTVEKVGKKDDAKKTVKKAAKKDDAKKPAKKGKKELSGC